MFDFRHVYCAFCETGKEEIAKLLCERILGVKAILLTSERSRFFRGQHRKMTVKVLPSYLFLYLRDDIDVGRISRIEHVFRVLSLSGEHQLHESDLKFARWVHESGGTVKTSQAYRQGDRIVVVDGPLKDYEGDIVWVDKRKGKAKVHIVTESLDIFIWLFFKYIDPSQGIGSLGAVGFEALPSWRMAAFLISGGLQAPHLPIHRKTHRKKDERRWLLESSSPLRIWAARSSNM